MRSASERYFSHWRRALLRPLTLGDVAEYDHAATNTPGLVAEGRALAGIQMPVPVQTGRMNISASFTSSPLMARGGEVPGAQGGRPVSGTE